MQFEPSNFWFIKLRDSEDRGERKKPAEAWGGYSIPFSENDKVYSWEQTNEMSHDNFAVVGFDGYEELVILDVDCYKIDDFDPDLLLRPDDGVPIVKSESDRRDVPGFHFYCLLIDNEVKVKGGKEYVEVKANSKGHAVSPWHNDDYIVVHDTSLDKFSSIIDINSAFEYDGDDIITSTNRYTTEFGSYDVDHFESPPMSRPTCLTRALEARQNIPRDGSHPNPWYVDSVVGRRLVAFGYSKSAAMSLLERYPPQDGFSSRESAYQMDQLYRKELSPDKPQRLHEVGIMDQRCGCFFCEKHEDWSDVVPSDPKHADNFSL